MLDHRSCKNNQYFGYSDGLLVLWHWESLPEIHRYLFVKSEERALFTQSSQIQSFNRVFYEPPVPFMFFAVASANTFTGMEHLRRI